RLCVVRPPTWWLVDSRIQQDDVVAVGELIVRHPKESEDDDVGIARERTTRRRWRQRLTCGLFLERRIPGLSECGRTEEEKDECAGSDTHQTQAPCAGYCSTGACADQVSGIRYRAWSREQSLDIRPAWSESGRCV